MLLIRELLYQEKTLDDFDIDSETSIFKTFFEILLPKDLTKVTDVDVEKTIAGMINDACYICTLSLILKRPVLKLGLFRDLCNKENAFFFLHTINENRADVVLSMVVYLLKLCNGKNDVNLLANVIETHLVNRSEGCSAVYRTYERRCSQHKYILPKGYFLPRTITTEVLHDLNLDWKYLTNEYDKQSLIDLLTFWKDAPQRNAIIDEIIKDVEIKGVNNRFIGGFAKISKADLIELLESLRIKDGGKSRTLKDIHKPAKQPNVSEENLHLHNEIKHLKDEIEHLRKERDDWQKRAQTEMTVKEEAFNVHNSSSCFTSRQMGILMHAVSYFTEEKPVAKTTIGQVVEKISGYKATTINQNTRGKFKDSDKEAVAQAIEDKFPKLAAKVRKL